MGHPRETLPRGRRRWPTVLGAAAVAVAVCLVASGALAVKSTQGIATVAGTGIAGFSGDGGPAVQAQLDSPNGLDVDPPGGASAANPGLYIADQQNARIRRVDTAGVVTTVAGTGTPGFSGDGGPAAAAQLNDPADVAVDSQGNLYIADTANHRVRRVDPSGTITTLTGTGTPGFSGDGGPAAAAQLNGPLAVAVDENGKLYIADAGNHRVRAVNLGGGAIVTVAGTGAAGFSGDGGPATAAQLNAPAGLAFDLEGGVLYIADTANNRVRLIEQSGVVTTVAGTGTPGFSGDGGPATAAQLNAPVGLEYDRVRDDAARDLYIADSANHRIRKLDVPAGTITTAVGSGAAGFAGDGGQAGAAALVAPRGVALDASGNLFVADTFNERIRRVNNVSPIARFTATPAQGRAPLEVAFEASFSRDPQGGPLTYSWDFGDGSAHATGPTTSHTFTVSNQYAVTLTATDSRGSVSTATRTISVGRAESRIPVDPLCAPTAAPPPAGGAEEEPGAEEPGEEPVAEEPVEIDLSTGQLLINQRISQAAVRRANGVQAWLDAGIETRDICGAGLTAPAFDPGVGIAATSEEAAPAVAAPRPVKAASAGEGGGTVTLTIRQLLINQRISQAAVRRTNALKARLDGGLTGGDVRDGAITPNKLARGLTVVSAKDGATAPKRSVTRLAPRRSEGGRVTLTSRQLRINQRISQAAVRRANALRLRLERGLTSADFQPRTLSAADLASELRKPPVAP